jgi:signal transduction histidine kinase
MAGDKKLGCVPWLRGVKTTRVSTLSPSPRAELRHFETLMVELARALVRVTIADIDDEINEWLKRIATSLGLDRSTIAEINPVTGWTSFSHGWARTPYRMIAQPMDANALLPWTVQKMLAGETVVMTSPDKLPAEAAVDRESFRRYGPKSNVMVPIKVGGTSVGAVSFASLGQSRSWSPETVKCFQAVAEIFGCGLERKRTVEEIRRLRNELNYVSRITMMGELAASLAHELNQPLGAILNNAETVQAMLASDRPDLEGVRDGIADIIQDDNRAREIIQRVWALFRRDKISKTKVDVAQMLAQIGRLVRGEALRRNIPFSVDIREPIPPILAEQVQIQQAIMNLILNAFDALAGIGKEPREVHLIAKASDDVEFVVILVIDSGKGIGPDEIPRIFDAFFTTKPHGMGMGLAITKSIVEAHGGRLSASLNNDRGMTFEIRLPISKEEVH